MIILAIQYGRLGNQLYTISHLAALAMEFKRPLFCPFLEGEGRQLHFAQKKVPSINSGRVISGIANALPQKLWEHVALSRRYQSWFGKWKVFCEEEVSWLNEGDAILESALRKASVVSFQLWGITCENLRQKWRESILREMRPAEELARRIGDNVPPKDKTVFTVSIHIRQGDYRQWKGGAFYRPPEEYYALARDFMSQLEGGRVRFFFASDETLTIPEELAGMSFYRPQSEVLDDLYFLAEGDVLLATQSTFSMWADFAGPNRGVIDLHKHDRSTCLEMLRKEFQRFSKMQKSARLENDGKTERRGRGDCRDGDQSCVGGHPAAFIGRGREE